MREPHFWSADIDPRSREAAPLTRFLLTPLAAIYAMMTARRLRKTKPVRVAATVICVGNLTVGGVGKSPVVAALRQLLTEKTKLRVATLSRGYKARRKGPLKVNTSHHTAADVGDEPFMLAQTGESWIGRDRAAAGHAMSEDGVDIILMDDGHQNPGLRKDLSFVVVDAVSKFGNGFVIPKGPLREPVSVGLARADAVILMNASDALPDFETYELPIIRAFIDASGPLPQKPYVAFAGIGRPEKFFDTLSRLKVEVRDAVPFPDHHPYTEADIAYLRKLARDHEAQLITTEKDYVRLSAQDRADIITLPVSVRFEDQARLEHLLSRVVNV